mmetsp:Transcript_5375/g.14420  ORF Transcript_5375/g.14420 Transcript_5375/m.14420 type:complete len:219 (+) Transcript_5375:82-738(+)
MSAYILPAGITLRVGLRRCALRRARRHVITCQVFGGWESGFWQGLTPRVGPQALLPPAKFTSQEQLSRAIREVESKENLSESDKKAQELVFVQFEHTCLVAEIVDRSSSAPKCWLRPLILLSKSSLDEEHCSSENYDISDIMKLSNMYDLRACPHVILPNELVRPLLPHQATWAHMHLLAHDAVNALSDGHVADGTARLLALMRALIQHHPRLFKQSS